MKTEALPIVEKAWKIDLEQLDGGYESSEIVCHAENTNKAKIALLHKVKYDSWKLRWTGNEINYLNIPVVRANEYDLVLFEGANVTLNKVAEIKAKRERIAYLDGILNDESIKYCYIRKGSYYGPNCCGYTQYKFQAGVYTKEDAVSQAKSVSELYLEPINIAEHNEMIQAKIADLSSRIIDLIPPL